MRGVGIGLLAMLMAAFLSVSAVGIGTASTGAQTGGLKFTNIQLIRPDGNSEPAVAIAADGTTYLGGLSWIEYFTNFWRGPFGQTPTFQGPIDASIAKSVGGGDEDIDMGSTGTLHVSTLVFFFNPASQLTQLGVSAITCPKGDTSNSFAQCTAQILDTTQADRQWVTSEGTRVYISYHDSGSSTLIHVQRSDDDGFTWHTVSSPIVGQDGVTADSTFNNDQGPLAADPTTHNVYAIFAAGEPSIQKGTNANFNNIFVSKSTNMGLSWKATLVYHAPLNTALNNVFPTLAVDPATGNLYAAWSDAHKVYFSMSTDQDSTWSAPVTVNTGAANTAVFPWLAVSKGTIDLVYYGTKASSKDDPSAVWNTFMAQSTDGGAHWVQAVVSDHPNHVGVICTFGTGCARGTRNLLDLFEVAINPQNGLAAIIYTDDTLTTYLAPDGVVRPLPQVIVAYQG